MDNKIYEIDGEFAIADGGGWLPGMYETYEAAKYAFNLSYDKLYKLQELANKGKGGGKNGTISLDKLKTWEQL